MADNNEESRGITIYFHSVAIAPAPKDSFHDDVLSFTLRKRIDDIMELYVRGFFPNGSIIWINGDMPELGFWALTNKSSHIRTFFTPRALWCSMSHTAVKLATAANKVSTQPVKIFTAAGENGMDIANSTIVCSYPDRNGKMFFKVGAQSRRPIDGIIEWEPFTIIDLPNYKSDPHVTTNQLEIADAHQHGFELMTYGATEERIAYAHQNYDAFKLTLKENILRGISNESSNTNKAVEILIKKISNEMYQLQNDVRSQKPEQGGLPVND